MDLNYFQIFIPIICLLVNIAVQVFTFRNIKKLGLLNSVYLGFIVGFIAVFFFGFLNYSIQPMQEKNLKAVFLVNLITYSSLGYCYFHFINLGETARRIRILRELYDSREGLSMEAILQRYNANEIIRNRLNRLVSNNQVIYKSKKYFIGNNRSLLLIAKAVVLMKILILGRKTEFA